MRTCEQFSQTLAGVCNCSPCSNVIRSGLQALALVLGNPATQGSQQRSAFTTTMASNNLTATAMVLSENQIFNDSIGDQIYALTTPTSHGSSKKHLGAIIGSTVGSASALLILLAVFAAYGRGWLRSRKLNRRAAASTKVPFLPHCTAS